MKGMGGEGKLGMFNIDDYFGMDVIPLISEHLQRKKTTPNLLSYFCNQCLSNTFHSLDINIFGNSDIKFNRNPHF
jgi:hypothetical protein